WVYTPARQTEQYPLLLAFDGSSYKDILPEILDYLIDQQQIPPIMALMLDNPDRSELHGNDGFARLVAEQVMDWVRAHYSVSADPRQICISGSSSGGVGAAYIAMRYPHIFGTVLSQTGWFRWSPDSEHEW